MTEATRKSTQIDEKKFTRAVQSLLKTREKLLITYSNMLQVAPEDKALFSEDLLRFNQLLTDYSALGYFEVLHPFIEPDSEQPVQKDREMLAKLMGTTDQFLGFVDRYQPAEDTHSSMQELAQDLEALGMTMAERFELEDALISKLEH